MACLTVTADIGLILVGRNKWGGNLEFISDEGHIELPVKLTASHYFVKYTASKNLRV